MFKLTLGDFWDHKVMVLTGGIQWYRIALANENT